MSSGMLVVRITDEGLDSLPADSVECWPLGPVGRDKVWPAVSTGGSVTPVGREFVGPWIPVGRDALWLVCCGPLLLCACDLGVRFPKTWPGELFVKSAVCLLSWSRRRGKVAAKPSLYISRIICF